MRYMKLYQRPASWVLAITNENRFLASTPWYEKNGEDFGGDVDFEVENDETWG